jgi:hypothetical protein
VGPPLLDHRVGALAHLLGDPVSGATSTLAARNARTEIELGLHIRKSFLTVEGRLRAGRLAVA